MTTATRQRLTARLTERFQGSPALAAAVNELNTCADYPEYLSGILTEMGDDDVEQAVYTWAELRGQIWE